MVSYFFTAKASIPVSSDSRVNVLENDEVRLWCNATGLPVPTITWYAIESNNQQEFIKGTLVLMVINTSTIS